MKIGVVYPSNGLLSILTNTIEILSSANQFVLYLNLEITPFEIKLLGEGVYVNKMYEELAISYEEFNTSHFDLVLITAIKGTSEDVFENNKKTITLIQNHFRRNTVIVSLCSGALLLAEAGILNQKIATTHWAHQNFVKSRFPAVNFRYNHPYIDLGNIITGGGAYTSYSVILHLIEKFKSRKLALYTSKMYLTDFNRDTVQYFKPVDLKLDHNNQRLLKIQHYIMKVYSDHISIEEIASKFCMSSRNLAKIFKIHLDVTPSEFLKSVRINNAVTMLEAQDKSIKEVMFSTGYNDRSAFRKAFKKLIGLNPSEYRKKYNQINLDSSQQYADYS